jgi:hypothetical protein
MHIAQMRNMEACLVHKFYAPGFLQGRKTEDEPAIVREMSFCG